MMQNKSNGSLDTNSLLRLLLGDVPSQTKAVEVLIEKSTQLDVSDTALIEFMFVLEKCYKFERSLVCNNVRTILSSAKINCNRKMFILALELYEAEPKLSVVDCVLLVYARLNKAVPLYSFDKALIKKSKGDCISP